MKFIRFFVNRAPEMLQTDACASMYKAANFECGQGSAPNPFAGVTALPQILQLVLMSRFVAMRGGDSPEKGRRGQEGRRRRGDVD